MSSLNISKVAVGCASYDALEKRQQSRLSEGCVPIVTRFKPKRADELIGGSIFWIVKHRLVARQAILGFEERAEDKRIVIRLSPELVQLRARPKRAHQGWRYLTAEDAPPDLNGDEDDGMAALPSGLAVKLASLALI